MENKAITNVLKEIEQYEDKDFYDSVKERLNKNLKEYLLELNHSYYLQMSKVNTKKIIRQVSNL